MALLVMQCFNCSEIIKLKEDGCALCVWLNHCCPGYYTTQDVKWCDFHQAVFYYPYILNKPKEIGHNE